MGKHLVKSRIVDILDSQWHVETAPLSRWDAHSGFMASSSGCCSIPILDRGMCFFSGVMTPMHKAAPTLRFCHLNITACNLTAACFQQLIDEVTRSR
ncbi:unnamed protein product [Brassica rapa]|uniref:Uncharacterized protein n=2 Tax=Brassica TaxID=3705 RepID=A0A3P5Y528_BRACM|nr:unnamed protein product [Brassica napus]CAG7865406.1 unnamed protein product [Brassica rapa]VDC62479.1 unnamed protein product [Brassica rapa]